MTGAEVEERRAAGFCPCHGAKACGWLRYEAIVAGFAEAEIPTFDPPAKDPIFDRLPRGRRARVRNPRRKIVSTLRTFKAEERDGGTSP